MARNSTVNSILWICVVLVISKILPTSEGLMCFTCWKFTCKEDSGTCAEMRRLPELNDKSLDISQSWRSSPQCPEEESELRWDTKYIQDCTGEDDSCGSYFIRITAAVARNSRQKTPFPILVTPNYYYSTIVALGCVKGGGKSNSTPTIPPPTGSHHNHSSSTSTPSPEIHNNGAIFINNRRNDSRVNHQNQRPTHSFNTSVSETDDQKHNQTYESSTEISKVPEHEGHASNSSSTTNNTQTFYPVPINTAHLEAASINQNETSLENQTHHESYYPIQLNLTHNQNQNSSSTTTTVLPTQHEQIDGMKENNNNETPTIPNPNTTQTPTEMVHAYMQHFPSGIQLSTQNSTNETHSHADGASSVNSTTDLQQKEIPIISTNKTENETIITSTQDKASSVLPVTNPILPESNTYNATETVTQAPVELTPLVGVAEPILPVPIGTGTYNNIENSTNETANVTSANVAENLTGNHTVVNTTNSSINYSSTNEVLTISNNATPTISNNETPILESFNNLVTDNATNTSNLAPNPIEPAPSTALATILADALNPNQTAVVSNPEPISVYSTEQSTLHNFTEVPLMDGPGQYMKGDTSSLDLIVPIQSYQQKSYQYLDPFAFLADIHNINGNDTEFQSETGNEPESEPKTIHLGETDTFAGSGSIIPSQSPYQCSESFSHAWNNTQFASLERVNITAEFYVCDKCTVSLCNYEYPTGPEPGPQVTVIEENVSQVDIEDDSDESEEVVPYPTKKPTAGQGHKGQRPRPIKPFPAPAPPVEVNYIDSSAAPSTNFGITAVSSALLLLVLSLQ